MKTLATITAAIAFSALSFTAMGQAGDKKEKELDKTQERERTRSTQGLRTDNELKDDRGEVQSNQYRKKEEADTLDNQVETSNNNQGEVLEKNPDQGLGTDDDGNGLTNENNTTQGGEERTNTPAVIQRTTSESGSPAILSGDNGTKRDGTNNVQRAKPNIAGAEEPGNMNLGEKKSSERNRNTGTPRIRKQEEQPNQSTDAASKQAEKNQNKSASPTAEVQAESTAEPQAVEPKTAREERKAKRKARRNNRKD
ncbi:MAG TPA: hypothetical protein VGD65_23185 [Chryseosolibacter sp.]